MKKIIAILMIIVCIVSTAVAEIDLSLMTDDELLSLRDAVRSEILSRSKWESVTVPTGFYVVGTDIPVGHWTIRYKDPYAIVYYFAKTDETGKNPDIFSPFYQANIGAPGNDLETLYNLKEVDIDLQSGYYLTIEFGSVIFEPFTGRSSPFFD